MTQVCSDSRSPAGAARNDCIGQPFVEQADVNLDRLHRFGRAGAVIPAFPPVTKNDIGHERIAGVINIRFWPQRNWTDIVRVENAMSISIGDYVKIKRYWHQR